MNLGQLKEDQKAALDGANKILTTAEAGARGFTHSENMEYTAHMEKFKALTSAIKAREEQSTIRNLFTGGMPNGMLGGGEPGTALASSRRGQSPMSEDYTQAFLAFIRSGGKQAGSALSEGFDPLFGGFAMPALPGMSAAMYESSSSSGGYAVSVPTDPHITPLAVPDLGVRSIARVIPTQTDIKIPSQLSFSTAAIKAESGGSTNQFATGSPTLGQLTLSAFMMGVQNPFSWEVLQDVSLFQEFGVRDLLTAVDILEDGYFVTGSGTNQPQGLLGNVGTGTGAAYAVESTGGYLLDATEDVTGTIKAAYAGNAGWLMNRSTGTAIRKAQRQANLFAPVWTRENGRDFLHGFPVAYSQNMPNLPTATTAGVTPLLFGSFADGYVIGDRGGSGTFVKILDQPLATSGQTILLAYKRTDGRVRRSEALQQVSISHA